RADQPGANGMGKGIAGPRPWPSSTATDDPTAVRRRAQASTHHPATHHPATHRPATRRPATRHPATRHPATRHPTTHPPSPPRPARHRPPTPPPPSAPPPPGQRAQRPRRRPLGPHKQTPFDYVDQLRASGEVGHVIQPARTHDASELRITHNNPLTTTPD